MPTEPALVLVVDDREPSRYAKTRTLRQAGFTVAEAATGAEALRVVEAHRPRLVVLDVHLPDVSGWDVCRRIKQDGETASTLVLQISATYVRGIDTVRALEGGADGCLTEPVEPPVLVATVRALLRAREAEDAVRHALEREHEARREAEAACAAAEAANRTKDEFLAVLSHELRSPLGALLNWVSVLRRGGEDEAQRSRALDAIERNGRLQIRLIEDLLDVSRIISGRMRLELAPVPLAAVVREAVDGVRGAADAKRLTVDVAADESLVLASGDFARLQQVTSNLLSNAVKFTGEGGRVEVRLFDLDGDACIEVRDDGRGIAPELLPHIFERFRQGDASTTRAQGGLGLGLAIVRHLVDLHGGVVSAHSAGPDLGATFRVRVPLRLTDAAAQAVPPMARQAGLPGDGGRATAARPIRPLGAPSGGASVLLDGVRVLLVDDHEDTREGLTAVLASLGASVIPVASGVEALDVLAHDAPDVLISDIAMPGMDGFALIDAVRAASGARRVPAIALTAHANASMEPRVRAAGFDACHVKPVDVDVLAGTLARLSRRAVTA